MGKILDHQGGGGGESWMMAYGGRCTDKNPRKMG